MARRKAAPTTEVTATHPTEDALKPAGEPAVTPFSQAPTTPETTGTSADNGQSAAEAASPGVKEAAGTEPQGQAHSAITAPPKGEGRSWTIDNRLGYRKEESADGRRRQIRFADRQGGQRPDDETLAPVREKKPTVSWSGKEKAWQARRDQEGLEAIDLADQQLAEIGRKRTGGPER